MKHDSNEVIRALTLYGLTKNEAAVYIALLKKLESTAFELAKATEIPRATVYLTLESLKRQGIISMFRKNNVAYFTPESPSRLATLLKTKEEILNGVMPQILAMTSRSIDTPMAKLYVGIDGLKFGFDDILDTLKRTKIKQILATSHKDMLEYLPKYYPNWLKQREDLGVYTKLILPGDSQGFLPSNELREVRYLPEKFPFNCAITIYAGKITFFSLEEAEPYCVIIESKSICDMFTQFFLFTWEMLGGSKKGI